LAILLPTTLLLFICFGINSSSTFYLSKKKYSSSEVFGSNIIITFLLSALALLMGIIITVFFNEIFFPGVEKAYLFLALSLIPFNFFFDVISSILLGLQKIKKYNAISFLQSFLFLFLAVVLLLGFKFGVRAAILTQIFSYVFAGIILFFIVLKETRRVIFCLKSSYFKDAFNFGIKNYLGGVLNFFHYKIDIFLINIFINPVAVGIYYIAVELAEGIWLISQSASTVFFPTIASETDEKRKKEFTPIVCRNILFVAFCVAFVLFLIAQLLIITFYSSKFSGAVEPFRILLIGTLFIAGWHILANDIVARGKPMINTCLIGLSLVLNIILNIIFIPKLGITGAAMATAISYSLLFFSTVFVYAKISDNKITDILFLKNTDIRFYKNFLTSLVKRKK
jgi:O-antigen/teichoic acid export membrane protein